ncbi:MAG: DUF6683 family protein [Myxococcaceae bacterium]
MNALRASLIVSVVVASSPAVAQSWNSNSGGWNTGYGTVYGSFGLANATQNMYNTMQLNLQRATMRQAMINKWGLAAVEEAERNAKAGKPAPSGMQVSAPPPAPKNLGVFKPSAKSTTFKQLGDALGGTAEEKQAITTIAQATRDAFESQPDTAPWKNNVAGALTFFLVGNLVIATGSEEPSDEATKALFNAISQTLDASPEFAKTSAKDKQALYEALIGFTGIPLAISSDAKERGDAKQEQQARELAARLIQLVLKVDAAQVKLN